VELVEVSQGLLLVSLLWWIFVLATFGLLHTRARLIVTHRFSPAPCPVEWYEYFYVVGLVVLFSRFVEGSVLPAVKGFGHFITLYFLPLGEEDDGINIRQTLFGIIERTTGIEPDMDSTLDEVGLASVGILVIVGMLNGAFSTKREPLAISQQDLLRARTIADIIEVVENARARMHHDGV